MFFDKPALLLDKAGFFIRVSSFPLFIFILLSNPLGHFLYYLIIRVRLLFTSSPNKNNIIYSFKDDFYYIAGYFLWITP